MLGSGRCAVLWPVGTGGRAGHRRREQSDKRAAPVAASLPRGSIVQYNDDSAFWKASAAAAA